MEKKKNRHTHFVERSLRMASSSQTLTGFICRFAPSSDSVGLAKRTAVKSQDIDSLYLNVKRLFVGPHVDFDASHHQALAIAKNNGGRPIAPKKNK